MALIGADTDQLRQLSSTLTHAADRLESMGSEVSGRLASASWVGPDADRYRSQWHGESLSLVRSVVGALRDASSVIDRNAAEQDQASSGASAAALGGTPSAARISRTGGHCRTAEHSRILWLTYVIS